MGLWHVIAALLSAVLHAAWNAAVKAHPKPAEVMTAQMVLSALLGVPALYWTGLPNAAAWPWIADSTSINLVIVTALLRAYGLIGFGTAYPVVRALSVLLVTPAALLLAGEHLSVYSLLGIGLIVASLLLLALGNQGHAPLAYGFVVSATNAAAMFVFQGFAARRWHSVVSHAGMALPIAIATPARSSQ